MKKISLVDLIMHRQGNFILRLLHAIFGVTLSLFFRRIELVNTDALLKTGGLIFVMNHPNALIDPALVFIALPYRMAFLAKAPLFKIPIIGYLVRTIGALPLYRQQDAGADVSQNRKTFEITRELLKKGGAIAIFPEGVSHNLPGLMPLKTGAARIALGAVSVGTKTILDLQIVPVGLFYTNKTVFRSEALLHFGEPFRVSPIELEDGQPPKDAVKSLTAKIENALRGVTFNAESETQSASARIAEEVFTSTTIHEENLAERLEFLQKFVAEASTEKDKELEQKLIEYGKALDAHGIESEFLELARYSKWFIFRQALIRSWYLLLLSPLALIRLILHFPAYQLCKFLAYLQTRRGEYDMASTMKVLAGLVFVPLTWVIIATVLCFYTNWETALLSVPVSALCGYIALKTLEELEEMSGWAKAILLFVGKREKFLRLLAKRQDLFEKLSSKN